MNIARVVMQLLAGAALLITAFCSVSQGQAFPDVFHGVWIVSVAEENACKTSDWEKHEHDGLLRVDAREAQFWASLCTVKRITPSPWDGRTSVDLTLACREEGEVASVREVWSIVDIGSRRRWS